MHTQRYQRWNGWIDDQSGPGQYSVLSDWIVGSLAVMIMYKLGLCDSGFKNSNWLSSTRLNNVWHRKYQWIPSYSNCVSHDIQLKTLNLFDRKMGQFASMITGFDI